jgi:hypothetical protein
MVTPVEHHDKATAEVADIPDFSGPSIILGWLSRSGDLCANIRGPSFWTRALSWINCKPCCIWEEKYFPAQLR